MAFYDYDLTEQVKGKHGLSKMALSQNVSGKDLELEKPAFTERK